jgi:galactokinase
MRSCVWFAPGRANLMGEHTDYNEGLVLPFALAQGVTTTAYARPDGLLVMRSKQMRDDVVSVPLTSLAPGSVPNWAAYPAGVAWALREAGFDVPGASIEVDSDLPVGAGVSSSAALECSAALALCSLAGVSVPRRTLATIARKAENDFVGAPTGIIDQHASLLCEAGHAMLLDCATREITHVPFRPSAGGAAVLIIDTHVPHALVSGEYGQRRAECEQAARSLGVPFLGRITNAVEVERLSDPVLRRRARHVISDDARAQAIAAALGEAKNGPPGDAPGGPPGDAPGGPPDSPPNGPPDGAPDSSPDGAPEIYRFVGKLFTEAHASLRDDFEVSWPEADLTVEAAIAAGALGARMIGGGFGGSVLALIPVSRLPAVRAAVTRAFAQRSWTAPEFLNAVPSAAARQIA